MRSLFPLALSLTLIGCATTKTDVRNEAQISQYDPANSARVRLITGDTTNAGFLSGQTCEAFYNGALLTKTPEEAGWQNAHVDSAGLYPFRATDSQNSVIGMPASKASKAINQSPKVFDEHVIAAGKPFIAGFAMGGSQMSCFPAPVTLIPEPGNDYEMELQMVKISTFKAGCVIAVRQLSVQGNNTVETPLRPQVCAKTPSGWYTVTPKPLP
ncbi:MULTISPECIES: hypothetical protein [Pseudomonas]|uniref:Lipoprotein n=1 Tax=Pseudomonas fluorescens LMG 5329 TaxID=1324332 RepID=A0A0A1YU27_PSEFL|nr:MULTISPECIES: hypothetical protein [Pseudomonas]KGE65520.1 hypothetical protein K814_0123815 [Pseudomonas fluorescens LMG 5329]NWE03355.1 hypothetical protein [Pseudomonas sp. IPO3749]NWF19841.1 hypothetical protein [Pseudomonas sp. IPO3749]